MRRVEPSCRSVPRVLVYETECGLYVVELHQERALVLRSSIHLPMSWRDRAKLDWTWAFVLTPLDDGQRTRYHFRSRWVTEPWWFSAVGLLGVVPAAGRMWRQGPAANSY